VLIFSVVKLYLDLNLFKGLTHLLMSTGKKKSCMNDTINSNISILFCNKKNLQKVFVTDLPEMRSNSNQLSSGFVQYEGLR